MSDQDKKIIDLVKTEGGSAASITSNLKEIGDGNMHGGIQSIAARYERKGEVKGFIEGGIVIILLIFGIKKVANPVAERLSIFYDKITHKEDDVMLNDVIIIEESRETEEEEVNENAV